MQQRALRVFVLVGATVIYAVTISPRRVFADDGGYDSCIHECQNDCHGGCGQGTDQCEYDCPAQCRSKQGSPTDASSPDAQVSWLDAAFGAGLDAGFTRFDAGSRD